ncbi:hypothetical protein [Streptomyces sp. NBC_01565]|uniref:hypothetical protein n=1 Tax=unclassified Streptomyces TaxID=2593676 RepID=UPI00225949AC|nr:hypothetical protein [Streptomyces sp. NBC_01565]MCX4545077.1 hypothetical protein [Streptomyces sp. NBC_01565]
MTPCSAGLLGAEQFSLARPRHGEREALLRRVREYEQAATEQFDKLRAQPATRRNAPYAPAPRLACRVLTRGDPPPRSLSGLAPAGEGAIPAIAGAVFYTMPAERPELYVAAALVLAAIAAWCCALRQD